MAEEESIFILLCTYQYTALLISSPHYHESRCRVMAPPLSPPSANQHQESLERNCLRLADNITNFFHCFPSMDGLCLSERIVLMPLNPFPALPSKWCIPEFLKVG